MKRTIRIIAVCFAAIFCILGTLSLFSGKLIEKLVLPEAEKLLGVQVSLESGSLNLLSGCFTAKGLAVANPEGFEEPNFITADKAAVDLSLLSLLRGRIVISSSALRNFTLHVIRNADGKINANYFAKRLQRDETDTEVQKEETGVKVPSVKLSRIRAEARVRYIDHAFTTNTLDYSFITELEAKEVSNYEEPDEFGSFTISGHLENNPKVLSSSITGRVATVSDPLHPTFEIDGYIKSIHVPELDALATKIGLSAKEFTIETPFKSKQGKLRGDFTLTLTEPMPRGKLAKKIKNTKLPHVVTVTVPIRGTVEEPRIDWTGAVLQSLLGNALGNLDAAMKNVDLNQDEVEKQIDSVVDSFKELFKKKKTGAPPRSDPPES